MMAFLAVANGIGRVAGTHLHLHAAFCVTKRNSFSSARVRAQLESGGVSRLLPPVSEAAGMLLTAPFLCWCFSSAPPFYVSTSLLLLSWCLLLLFVSTFSRYVRLIPRHEAPLPVAPENRGDMHCLPLLGEVMAASTGDVASLVEEGRWTPAFRRQAPAGTSTKPPPHRVRSFSADGSVTSDPAPAAHDGCRDDFTSSSPRKGK
jgi:hypothetical protein